VNCVGLGNKSIWEGTFEEVRRVRQGSWKLEAGKLEVGSGKFGGRRGRLEIEFNTWVDKNWIAKKSFNFL